MRELSMKEEQHVQYEVLQYFTDICRQEGLAYYLAYGTLLGAVREHGFIEWDDDIDIWMPRTDYNRFIDVAAKYPDPRYFIQTFDTDPQCLATGLGRICVNNTVKWTDEFNKVNFHKGIYFDIFPLDNGFGNWKDDYYCFWFKIYQALLLRKVLQKPEYTGKSILKKSVNWILYHTISEKGIRRKIRYIMDIFATNDKGSTKIALAAAYAGRCRTIFDSKVFFDTVELKFENLQLACPAGYKTLLRYMYGEDYMIPSKTKPSYTPARIIKE